MLQALASSIFPLYLIATLIAFLFPFIKNKQFKELSIKSFATTVRPFGLVLAVFCLLMLAGNFIGLTAANYVAYFAGGFVCLYILNNIGLPGRLSGIVLLLASVILTMRLPAQPDAMPLVAAAAGIIAWKLLENLYWEVEPTYEDVVPALLWLLGIDWIVLTGPQNLVAAKESLLLGALSVMLLFRLFETPFLSDDKVYLKRLVLAATGGLALLIVVTKLVLDSHFVLFALVFGGGIFVSYLLQELEGKDESIFDALYAILLIGVATVVAYRLFGGLGLIILAITTQVGKGKTLSHYAGLFWITRVLLQAFIINWVPNVTGINTTHPYVGAALYGGMLLILVLSIMARDVKSTRLYLLAFLAAGALVPIFGNFFLHEEATGGLLQSACIAAVLVAVLGTSLYQTHIVKHGNLILLPTMLVAFGCLSNELIPLGNTATTTTKISIIAYTITAFIVLSALIRFLMIRGQKQPSGSTP